MVSAPQQGVEGADGLDSHPRSAESELAVIDSQDAWSNDDFTISTSIAPSSAIEDLSKCSWAGVHPKLRNVGLGGAAGEQRAPQTKHELRSSIEAKISQIEGDKQSERVQTAVSVIWEMSTQLEDALQRSVTNVINDMQFEMAAVREKLATDATVAEKAADTIEQIPGLVLETVQAKVAAVTHNLHAYVAGVMRGNQNAASGDALVDKLCFVPEEVRRMTTLEMGKAVEESESVVEKQFELARATLPDAEALAETERQVTPVIKDVLPGALAFATAATVDGAKAVVQAVQSRKNLQLAIKNQVVADALLRAKVDGGHRKGNLAFVVANPGSLGHPELCVRPCLYFTAGECVNGTECNFCHLPHPDRPAHLDKRHRNFLKTISVIDLLSMAQPILEERANLIELPAPVLEVLAKLKQLVMSSELAQPESRSANRYRRSLGTALRAMTIRSLTTTLQRQIRERAGTASGSDAAEELMTELVNLIGACQRGSRGAA